jgi:hypothetical protein
MAATAMECGTPRGGVKDKIEVVALAEQKEIRVARE